jgi:hypothetical protein
MTCFCTFPMFNTRHPSLAMQVIIQKLVPAFMDSMHYMQRAKKIETEACSSVSILHYA